MKASEAAHSINARPVKSNVPLRIHRDVGGFEIISGVQKEKSIAWWSMHASQSDHGQTCRRNYKNTQINSLTGHSLHRASSTRRTSKS